MCGATAGTVAKQVRQARQPQGARAGYRQEVCKCMLMKPYSGLSEHLLQVLSLNLKELYVFFADKEPLM